MGITPGTPSFYALTLAKMRGVRLSTKPLPRFKRGLQAPLRKSGT